MKIEARDGKPAYMLRRYFVRWGEDVIEVHCDPDDPSRILKELLEEKTGIPIDDQRIFYAGMKKPFECDKNLRYYGAQGGGFFDLARDEDLDDDFNITKKPSGRRSSRRSSLPSDSGHASSKQHRSSSVIGSDDMKKQMAKVAEEEARKALAAKTQARLEAYKAKRAAAEAKKAEEAAAKEREMEESMRQCEMEESQREEARAARMREKEAKRAEKEEADRRAAEAAANRRASIQQVALEEAARKAAEAEAALESARQKALQEENAKRAAEVIVVMVKAPDGKEILVEMKRSDDIASIQEQVASESGIEVPQQILKLNGKELTGEEIADSIGLDNGSEIDLEAKPVALQVKTPEGQTIPVEMNPYDTIQSMKEKIASKTGIEVDQQILKSDGKELSSDKTVLASGLKDGSVIDLEQKPINLQVKTTDGKTIPVQIKPSDPIEKIKEKLAQETGVGVDRQVLSFDSKELPNDAIASDMGLKDGSVLGMEASMQLQVKKPDGKTLSVQVLPSATIQSVKEKIAGETGMVVDQQVLKCDGKELPNDATTGGLGLKDGSVLDLEARTVEVKVNTPDGQTVSVHMKPSDTIQSVKEQIAAETGMDVDQQVLKCEGKELPNDATASSLGLKDGSVLDLEAKAVEVKVKTPDGQTIAVQMKPSDTIQSVKEKVAAEAGIEVDQQVLKHDGNELPNDATASDLGLKDGTVFDLEARSMELQVNTPDGQTMSVMVKPSDSIHSIKEKLAGETGADLPKQILKFNGQELEDSQTAGGAGLKEGSILDLEAKADPKPEKKEKKKKKKKEKKEQEFLAHASKDYSIEYKPKAFDLSRFKIWFMVGDQIPFEMVCPASMDIKTLKVEILKLRNEARFVKQYFDGIEDPNVMKIYPPGSWGEGDPLPDDIPVPRTSSEYDFFSVHK